MRYAVVIEKTDNGFSAYAPDLPGCVAAGDSRAETARLTREACPADAPGASVYLVFGVTERPCLLIREAIALHVQALKEQGHPPPSPTTSTQSVQVR